MHLLVLGSGTLLQEDQAKNCSGYLLDNFMLFDCGPGIWRALSKHHIPVKNVNNIFLTHFHIDHTSDLAPLLLNRWLIADTLDQRLQISGPLGLKDWFSKLTELAGTWMLDLPIDLIEMNDKSYGLNNYTITSLATGHTENSICYRVEKEGKSIFYSGDTDYNKNVITLASSCDLAIIEASNTEETRIAEHLTPELAAKIAETAKVKWLLLTHMYPEVMKGNPLKTAKEHFTGKVSIATDGMEIRL
jgi:ribonuclease BN (tRNA processing enzyme)